MKRKYGGRFDQQHSEGGDINPLEGMANLADIMLVFACGLMLALIINWNVDVAGLNETARQRTEVRQMEGLTGDENSEPNENINYIEKGTVYEDPETGKLYMVENGQE